MARTWEKCGGPVSVGSGKWLGDRKRSETVRLFHKHASICDLAKVRINAKRESATQVSKKRRDALGEALGLPQQGILYDAAKEI